MAGNVGRASSLWLALRLAPSSKLSLEQDTMAVRQRKEESTLENCIKLSIPAHFPKPRMPCRAKRDGEGNILFTPKLLRQFSEICFEESENRAVITTLRPGFPNIKSSTQLLIISAH